MTLWLKALVALAEDLGSFSVPFSVLITIYNSSSRGSNPLFWNLWVRTAAFTDKQANTHTDIF